MADKKAIEKGLAFVGNGMDATKEELPLAGKIIDNPSSLLNVTPIRKTSLEMIYGETYASFTKELSVSVGIEGSFGGYSASVDTQFDSTSRETTTTQFLKLSTTVAGSVLSIGWDLDVLRANLTSAFATAIESKSPAALIKAYGTHLVAKAEIGGRAEYYCSASSSEKVKESRFKVLAKAGYSGIGGSISGSSGVSTADKEEAKRLGGNKSLNVLGGSATTRTALQGNKPEAWTDWADSIKDNPGYLGVRGGLIPLWQLASTKKRRDELKSGIIKEAAKNLVIRVFSISATQASEFPDMSITLDDEYKLIGGGAFVEQGSYGNLLTASFPASNNTWRARSKAHDYSDPAIITVYAFGLYDPEDIWDVAITKKLSAKSDRPEVSAQVKSGFVLVGGGAFDDWEGMGNLLTASRPSDDGRSWIAKGKCHGHDDRAPITAYAIGIKSKIGLTASSKINPSKSGVQAFPSARAAPTRGYALASGGAATTWVTMGQLLTSSYPKDGAWFANSKHHKYPEPGRVTAYAIGLKVT